MEPRLRRQHKLLQVTGLVSCRGKFWTSVWVTLEWEPYWPHSSTSSERSSFGVGEDDRKKRGKKWWRRVFCQDNKGRETQVRSQHLHQGLHCLPEPHEISKRARASCLCRVFLKPPTSKTPLFLCFKVPLKVGINLPVFSPRQMQRRKTKRTCILWAQV